MADPLRQTYGEVFFLTSGLQRDPYGLANFHPASNVNRLDIYLEDGVSTNVVMVNFKADGKGYPTSVFFPTLYGGTVQKVITGEASARSFAKYSLLVPPQVLQWNANGTSTLSLQTTVVQTAGDGLLGAFENYTALTTAHPATEDLMDAGSIAYVYTTVGSDEYGFYAVTYDSVTTTYSWTAIENPVTQINLVDTKQYNIVGMQIQKGNLPRPTSTVTISDEYIRYILAYIATVNDNCNLNKDTLDDHEIRITALETDVDAIIAGTQDITFNNTISGLVATTLKGAVDEVAIAISNMKDGTSPFTKLTLTDGAGGTAEFYYDGTDPILKYRNITGELFKNLFLEVEPASGVTFENGMQVMYAGSIGASGKRLAKPTVLSELQVLPGLYLGAITEVTSEGYGIVNWYGNVNGLDTSGMTLGAVVYVGDNGTWTTTKPVSPLPQIPIGLIERVNPAEGRISVRPNIGNNLGDLHNVYLNGHTFVGGETIMYNISTNRYEVYDLGGKITTIEGRITAIEDNKATDFSVIDDVKYPTTKAVKDYVDTRQTTIYDFKGSVLFEDLPTTGQKVGDTYNITNDFTLGGEDYLAGTNVAWNGTSWDALGSHIPVAGEIDYDNGDSTLVAVNVKTALDELDTKKENVSNKVTSFQATPDNDKYPSEKLVYDTIKNIGLDTPITELNNHSLREVFEYGNLVLNPLMNENITSWSNYSTNFNILESYENGIRGLYINNSGTLRGNGFISGYQSNNNAFINDYIYMSFELKKGINDNDNQAMSLCIRSFYDTNPLGNECMIFSLTNDFVRYRSIKQLLAHPTLNNVRLITYRTVNDTYTQEVIGDNAYLINMTSLGIDTLTVSQMDYWYGVYQAISTSTTYGFLNTLYDLFSSKANTTLETWIAPTLVNSWAGTTARYYKNNFGEIRLAGSITTGTIGTTAFTLPTGYRPSQIVRCPVESNGSFGYVVINTDGTVVPTAGSNVRFSLDGVYFRGA